MMILLVHLKFCWCILNFDGADFEGNNAPAKNMHQQNSAGVHQKIPTLGHLPCLQWKRSYHAPLGPLVRLVKVLPLLTLSSPVCGIIGSSQQSGLMLV
jgi:hypothetical protein